MDAVVLNSRDKAPFLMMVEVMYNDRKCGAADIYDAFRLEDVQRRRDAGSPAYTAPTEPSPLLTALPLDEHIQPSEYFQPDDSLTPMKEIARSSSLEGVWVKNSCENGAGSLEENESLVKSRHEQAMSSFGEPWDVRKARLQKISPVGHLEGWDMISVIFKAGDDCRQELLAMQLIILFDEIFRAAQLPLQLRPYGVLVTSPESGLIETVPNSISIDSLKKKTEGFESLLQFFHDCWGPHESETFKTAQRNFTESMAAYSVVCYLLQIKDRHNGNILLDREGRIVHIDFGFMFSNSPGGNINFEAAPFKLTREFVEVMDGEDSECFGYFRMLVLRGFLEARKGLSKVRLLVDILFRSEENMPCFLGGEASISQLEERFMADLAENDLVERVMEMVDESIDNWRTVEYDNYQRITNGIL